MKSVGDKHYNKFSTRTKWYYFIFTKKLNLHKFLSFNMNHLFFTV